MQNTANKSKRIFRVVREKGFTTIDNQLINNADISFKAKGLMLYLLSKPDTWEPNIADMQKHATDGRDSVRGGLAELERERYLVRTRVSDRRNGQFVRWEYTVYERPDLPSATAPRELNLWEIAHPVPITEGRQTRRDSPANLEAKALAVDSQPRFSRDTPVTGFPKLANPTSGNPIVGNPTQVITESSKTENDDVRNAPARANSETTVDVVVSLISEVGFDKRDASQLVTRYGFERVCIALRCLRLATRRPGNPRGYVVQAIVQRWSPRDATTTVAGFDAEAETRRALEIVMARKAGTL